MAKAHLHQRATPQEDIGRMWSGSWSGIDLQMDLHQEPGTDDVNGTLSALGFTYPVSGTNHPPNVKLSGSSPDSRITITLTATWKDDDAIEGHFDGGGFNHEHVVFTRGR